MTLLPSQKQALYFVYNVRHGGGNKNKLHHGAGAREP